MADAEQYESLVDRAELEIETRELVNVAIAEIAERVTDKTFPKERYYFDPERDLVGIILAKGSLSLAIQIADSILPSRFSTEMTTLRRRKGFLELIENSPEIDLYNLEELTSKGMTAGVFNRLENNQILRIYLKGNGSKYLATGKREPDYYLLLFRPNDPEVNILENTSRRIARAEAILKRAYELMHRE